MKLRIMLLGTEILSLEWGALKDEEVQWVEVEEEPVESEGSDWAGASLSGSWVERDVNPLSPEQRFEYVYEEDKRRGFGFC